MFFVFFFGGGGWGGGGGQMPLSEMSTGGSVCVCVLGGGGGGGGGSKCSCCIFNWLGGAQMSVLVQSSLGGKCPRIFCGSYNLCMSIYTLLRCAMSFFCTLSLLFHIFFFFFFFFLCVSKEKLCFLLVCLIQGNYRRNQKQILHVD